MNPHQKRANHLLALENICKEKEVDFNSVQKLLESVKTKRLYKRNNYHQTKISEEIDNAIKNEI